jgi:hypothetical protein
MGRPARDATQLLIDATGIPLDVEEAMTRLRTSQDALFRKVR